MNTVTKIIFILIFFSCGEDKLKCSLNDCRCKFEYYNRPNRYYKSSDLVQFDKQPGIAKIITNKIGHGLGFAFYPYSITNDSIILFFSHVYQKKDMEEICCAVFTDQSLDLGDYRAIFFQDTNGHCIGAYDNQN